MAFFRYAYRSFLARIRANAVTMLSISLFVAGATIGLTFYLNLNALLVGTAPRDNIVVVAQGAASEGESRLALDTARNIAVLEGIKQDGTSPLVARELMFEITLEEAKPGRYEPAVEVRGIDELSMKVHRAAIVKGTAPAPGSLEIILGRRVAERHPNLTIGHEIAMPAGPSRISGVFAANGSPYEDEVWTARAALELHTKSKESSSMTLVAGDVAGVPAMVDKINGTKALQAHAVPLTTFRARRAGLQTIARTVLILLILISVVAIFAIAATMNAAVEVRMPELAAMAAIGIRRGVLARVVIMESTLLALAGGLLGVAASMLIGSLIGTITFGSSTISLSAAGAVLGIGFGLAIVLGMIGAVSPAIQVGRLSILRALR